MADEKQVELLKSGVEAWNRWRAENPWEKVDLQEADLQEVNLSGAILFAANLIDADLRFANLEGTTLSGANLIDANLIDADLRFANLEGACLEGASLNYAAFRGTTLSGATLANSKIAFTSFGRCNLSRAEGLAKVEHYGPSEITTSTLEVTAAGLAKAPPGRQAEVETFLRGAGLEDHYLELFRSRIGLPIEFFSAFISYTHKDRSFAQRLYSDLQARGIRCWLDVHDLKLGSVMLDAINQAIRIRDRVILCCSERSLTSEWVDRELTFTFQKEADDARKVLIPLDLDGYLFDRWTSAKAPIVKERVVGDFKGWEKDVDLYERELERVIEALRPE